MRRRAFIAGLGGAAAWPVMARGQQAAMPVIGSLFSGSPEAFSILANGFYKGLKEAGYTDGQNVRIEYRWGYGRYSELPTLAAQLVERRVRVIVATGGEPSALAAKAATSTIPIVFGIGGDPVKAGLVTDINRPGGNATGISLLTPSLERKRVELLHEIVPRATLIAALVNPRNPLLEMQTAEVEEAARITGTSVLIVKTSDEAGLDAAFAIIHQRRCDGLVVTVDPFFLEISKQIATLAARLELPTIYGYREFALAGGLMSYGSSPTDATSTIGRYTGRVLSGANPAELPVWQAVKVDLVLNLKTAKSLGITCPSSGLTGRIGMIV
jgi:putative tryptophan/tyrosine transport system substrate-binding protein